MQYFDHVSILTGPLVVALYDALQSCDEQKHFLPTRPSLLSTLVSLQYRGAPSCKMNLLNDKRYGPQRLNKIFWEIPTLLLQRQSR